MSNIKYKTLILVSVLTVLSVTMACGTFQLGIVSSEEDLPAGIDTQQPSSDDRIAFEPTNPPNNDSASMQAGEPTTTIGVTDDSANVPDGWHTYTNQAYGYRFIYPPSAGITTFGPQGFSQEELPEGMEPGAYMEQLAEKYSDELCVIVEYGSGYVAISAPPNQFYNYTNCNNPAPGAGELVNRDETIEINGEQYQASGFEFIPSEEYPDGYFEAYQISLDDGKVIKYGSTPGSSNAYQEYLSNTKETLLQIIDTYQVVTGPDIQKATTTAIPNSDSKLTYENLSFNFRFYYPGEWTLVENPNYIEMTKDTLYLRIAYRSKAQSIALSPGIWPTGSFPNGEERQDGSIHFLDQSIPRYELVVEDKVIAVFYNGDDEIWTPHVDFAISLDNLAATTGEPISDADQSEVDAILESFSWVY